MSKETLITRKYVILTEIERLTRILEQESQQYSKLYNGKLSVMTKQLTNISKAINAY